MKTKKKDIAYVTLTVAAGDFCVVPDIKHYTRYTKSSVALKSKGDRVTLDAATKQFTVHHCKRGAVEFRVAIAPKGAYVPCGISFGPGQTPPRGRRATLGAARANFPTDEVLMRGGVLTFTDKCDPNTLGMSFEFYVLIQNGSGDLGIIDPGIQHDPTA
jgi:hypothetical protein